MVDINNLIGSIPQVPRRQTRMSYQPTQSTDSTNALLKIIQVMLSQQDKDRQTFESEFQSALEGLQDAIQNQMKIVEANDKQLVVDDITKLFKDLADKITNPVVNVDLGQKEVVEALKRIKIPENYTVDLSSLNRYLDSLNRKADELNRSISELELIAPDKVDIKSMPEIKMPELKIPDKLKIHTTATDPLAVRLSDGQKYYKAVAGAVREGMQAVALNSGNESPARQIVSGVKAMTGSPVQLTTTSVKVRWLEITTVGQPCAIGDSDASVDLSTPSNCKGLILTPLTPHKLRVSDPSLVYADGPSGAAVSYNYCI